MIFQTSCAYNLGIAKFGTRFTPLLEGSFITGYKEIGIGLQLAESIWLPPHRALFGGVFFKILVPNLTTRTIYQAPVKNRGQSSLAIAGHCSRLHAETPPCPTARCGQVGAQAGVGFWLQLLGGSLLKEEGQQPVKLLHGHYGSAGDIADGKHVFHQHWNLEPLD